MKVVIIEDETAATVNLKSIINSLYPDSEVLASLESVAGALEWFEANPDPDVIFMDIHLADGDAFSIFENREIKAPVIFTTAYDRYALEAFKVNSIDYLLKPIKSEDVRRAVNKLQTLSGVDRDSFTELITRVAGNIRHRAAFLIHAADKIIPVKTEEIAFCYSSDEKLHIRTFDGRDLPYDGTLEAITAELPDRDFFRANRQYTVSRNAVNNISVWFGNRLSVNLSVETPEKIIVSKAKTPEFKRWLTES